MAGFTVWINEEQVFQDATATDETAPAIVRAALRNKGLREDGPARVVWDGWTYDWIDGELRKRNEQVPPTSGLNYRAG